MSHVNEIIDGFYTQAAHGNPNTASFRFPAIEVCFGAKNTTPSAPLIAMLDTGADLCIVDDALISGLPLGSTMPTFLPDGSKSNMQMYIGLVYIPQIQFSLNGQYKAAPFRAQGKAYDIILGMDFIRFFEMSIQPRDEVVSLRFPGTG